MLYNARVHSNLTASTCTDAILRIRFLSSKHTYMIENHEGDNSLAILHNNNKLTGFGALISVLLVLAK